MKFKVGDRVKTKGGKLGTIKSYLPHDPDADYKVLLDGDLLHSYYFSIYLELIQPEIKEEPVIPKFKVGDKVKYLDATVKVKEVTIQDPQPYLVGYLSGHEWRCSEDDLELIQPEVQEPVPGKFYRTRGGDKVFYVGVEANGFFVYHSMDGKYFHYSTPTKYCKYRQIENDIVGEWVDEVVLPAVEIKQWAVVAINDGYGYGGKRGYVAHTFTSRQKAIDFNRGRTDTEIVELTGTLPERKIPKRDN